MNKKLVTCAKLFVAVVAHVVPCVCVVHDGLVLPQVVLASEGLVAGGAHEWPFAGVNPAVLGETAFGAEGLLAGAAFEWLLAGVDPLVIDEITLGIERLVANRADMALDRPLPQVEGWQHHDRGVYRSAVPAVADARGVGADDAHGSG